MSNDESHDVNDVFEQSSDLCIEMLISLGASSVRLDLSFVSFMEQTDRAV